MTAGRSAGRVAPLAAIVVAIVSVQFGASFAKRLFPVVGAEGTTALRLAFAAVMLVAVLRPWRAPVTRRDWPPLLGYGVALGAMNLCFYLALRTVPLGVAVALEFIGPLAVALGGARRPVDFGWLTLALAGMIILLPVTGVGHGVDPTGAALALAAGAGWGAYIVFGARAGRTTGTASAAIGALIAAVLVIPVGVVHAGRALFAPPVIAAGLVVALFSSAVPYALEMFALRRLPRHVFGTLMSAEPAVAALMGAAMLGEALGVVQWLGIVAIVVASLGTTWTAAGGTVVDAAV